MLVHNTVSSVLFIYYTQLRCLTSTACHCSHIYHRSESIQHMCDSDSGGSDSGDGTDSDTVGLLTNRVAILFLIIHFLMFTVLHHRPSLG